MNRCAAGISLQEHWRNLERSHCGEQCCHHEEKAGVIWERRKEREGLRGIRKRQKSCCGD